MMFSGTLADGSPCTFVVPRKTAERLYGTCFRDVLPPRAGMFVAGWDNPYEVLQDLHVIRALKPQVEAWVAELADDLSRDGESRRLSFSVPGGFIGWASTDCSTYYEQVEWTWMNPRRTAGAWFVADSECRAPRTRELTIVCSVKFNEDQGWVFLIHTMYPGPDVGPLRGDMSEKTGLVWFSWDHLGE